MTYVAPMAVLCACSAGSRFTISELPVGSTSLLGKPATHQVAIYQATSRASQPEGIMTAISETCGSKQLLAKEDVDWTGDLHVHGDGPRGPVDITNTFTINCPELGKEIQ